MKILFTGASSFTGHWFVRALAGAGHEVICPLRARLEGYSDLRRQRTERLQTVARLVPETEFGSEAFLRLVREADPLDLLCHHAADVTNYKSPDFDAARALANNTRNLREVFRACAGARGIVLTGTFFEPDEGVGPEPREAFSPYALSKGMTWQFFRYCAAEAGLALGKFVCPNPFGPWEEPRFTAYLLNTWKGGKPARIKTPDYVRDNAHVGLLAECYTGFAQQVAQAGPGVLKISPSGYAESNDAFARRIADETRARTGWPCELQVLKQQDFTEPLSRTNSDPATSLVSAWNESAAWDQFVDFYARPPGGG